MSPKLIIVHLKSMESMETPRGVLVDSMRTPWKPVGDCQIQPSTAIWHGRPKTEQRRLCFRFSGPNPFLCLVSANAQPHYRSCIVCAAPHHHHLSLCTLGSASFSLTVLHPLGIWLMIHDHISVPLAWNFYFSWPPKDMLNLNGESHPQWRNNFLLIVMYHFLGWVQGTHQIMISMLSYNVSLVTFLPSWLHLLLHNHPWPLYPQKTLLSM